MSPLKNLVIALSAGLFFALLCAVGAISLFEERVYDFFLRGRPGRERIDNVVFLDVDDAAIAYNGVYPWPRSIMADGFLRLKEYGTAAAIMDIDFIDKGPVGIDSIYFDRDFPADFEKTFSGIGSNVSDVLRMIRGIDRAEQAERRSLAEQKFSYPVDAAPDAFAGDYVDILPALPSFFRGRPGRGFYQRVYRSRRSKAADIPRAEDSGSFLSPACRSAIGMKKAEKELNGVIMAEGLSPAPLYTRIGINTGEMVVGNMGTSGKMNYTIMGNAVNLAARLEGVNKQYGTGILISEYTKNEIDDEFVCRTLDRVRVVGISTPLRLYELLGLRNEAVAPDAWEEAMALYEKREFAGAEKHFASFAVQNKEDRPALMYLDKCRLYMDATPPAGWDGVNNLSQK